MAHFTLEIADVPWDFVLVGNLTKVFADPTLKP